MSRCVGALHLLSLSVSSQIIPVCENNWLSGLASWIVLPTLGGGEERGEGRGRREVEGQEGFRRRS